jgi:cell division protein FtsB
MRGIKIKNRNQSKWKRLGIFLILLLVFGFLLNSVRNVYQKKKEAQSVLARMEEEKTKLEERDKFLKESLAKLATNEGMNFEIRKKLNVARAGESVAIVVEEEQPSTTKTFEVSAWQKLKDFFTGLFK